MPVSSLIRPAIFRPTCLNSLADMLIGSAISFVELV